MRPLRLVDVSPGPMLRDELSAAGDYSRRLSLSVADYFARLDCFVAKYEGGQPPELAGRLFETGYASFRTVCRRSQRALQRRLPAGVGAGTGDRHSLPNRPEQAARAACRHDGRPRQTHPGRHANDRRRGRSVAQGLRAYVADKIGRAGLRGIRFVGAHVDVAPLLRSFRVFVMLSDDQGCPNASLEAMAAGVPVVANDSGGTAEQVLHGINGFIIPTADPVELAGAVEILLRDSAKRQAFGAAARRHVEHEFPMARMVAGYVEAFTGTRCGAGGTRDFDEASACCLATEGRT